MKEHIAKVVARQDLTETEAHAAMSAIMSGEATPAQIAGFLVALRMKGETAPEIAGFARAMRERSARIEPKVQGRLVDTCGTGAARVKTFNVSTISAFVVAGAGVPVAKHGNRSVTSKCGSADVLEALGANIALAPEAVKGVIERVGVGFLFAPSFHPAMRHAAGPRKELGLQTVFNVLGPITNPANAKGQVLGVFDPKYLDLLAEALQRLGTEKALVAHGVDGLDEISTVGPTDAALVEGGRVERLRLTPEELKIPRAKAADVGPLDPPAAAALARAILEGKEEGPRRDIVLANAGAGIFVGGRAATIAEGIEKARSSVAGGRARKKLEEFLAATTAGAAGTADTAGAG